MNTLSLQSILDAVNDMTEGIAARRISKVNKDDPVSLVSSVNDVLTSLINFPHSDETAKKVHKVWDNIAGIYQYEALSKVELRYTRNTIILASLQPYDWLESLVQDALKQDSPTSWVKRIVAHLQMPVTFNIPNTNHQTFQSGDFLPGVDAPPFDFVAPRFQQSPEAQTRIITSTVLAIAVLWLKFPDTSINLDRFMIMRPLIKQVGHSIYFLDSIWDMFIDPEVTLTDRGHRNRHRPRTLQNIPLLMEKEMENHPLSNPSSHECQALGLLDDLITVWHMESNRSLPTTRRLSKTATIQTPTALSPQLPILPSTIPLSQKVFLAFLRRLLPVLRTGLAAHANSSDKMLRTVATRPDWAMPFRNCAPARIKSMSTIYSDPLRLHDKVGFWNALCYRGVFYGSRYGMEHCLFFNSYDEWVAFHKSLGKEDSYFSNVSAYGVSNMHRTIKSVEKYWNTCHLWTTFLVKHPKPTFKDMYYFIKASRFFNIGKLANILVCGDYVSAGIIPMPSAEMIGDIIFDVGKGAVDGMERLDIVPQGVSKEYFIHQFSSLNTFLEGQLSTDEKVLMDYSVIMLEHGLCKYKRLT